MFTNFDEVFRPWKKWQYKKLSDMDPCQECETHRIWYNQAVYGSPAEREDAVFTTPEECKKCIKRLLWTADCLRKLQWYEDHDERLKGE